MTYIPDNNPINKFQCMEIYGLYIFAFSLPLFDAPKHIGYCLLILGALGRMLCHEKIKPEKLYFYEILIIMILVTAIISTAINWPLHYGIKGFKRSFYFFSTFWILSRGKYSKDTVKKTIILLITGALIASFAGFLKFSSGNANEFDLLSINAANRSAAYVAIIVFVCTGILLDNCSDYNGLLKIFAVISLAATLLTLFIIGSRGALLSVVVTFFLLFALIFRHRILKKIIPLLLICSITAFALILLASVFPNSAYLQRFRHIGSAKLTLNPSEMSYGDQERLDYWRVGFLYAMQHPSFFGVGPRNFREININGLKLKRPLTAIAAETFKNKKVLHAHNWILTLLIEQGFCGLLFFVCFLTVIATKLIKNRPDKTINAVWVAAFSTCFLPVISGLFNSAFSDENGWLVFFILGLGMWFINENKYYCKG